MTLTVQHVTMFTFLNDSTVNRELLTSYLCWRVTQSR